MEYYEVIPYRDMFALYYNDCLLGFFKTRYAAWKNADKLIKSEKTPALYESQIGC